MEQINFSKVNADRAREAFNLPLLSTNKLYWAIALAEEAGEVCGVIKKIYRGMTKRDAKKIIHKMNNEWTEKCLAKGMEELEIVYPPIDYTEITKRFHLEKKEALKKEIADVYIYLDLLASAHEINIKEAVVEKFNEVSKEMEYPVTINLEQTQF